MSEHPSFHVQCENPECKHYLKKREVFPRKMGTDLYAFVGVFCSCNPYRELRRVK